VEEDAGGLGGRGDIQHLRPGTECEARRTRQAAYYQADGSCPIGPHTWRSAYWSAQSALAAAAAINSGAGHEVYALCRPPGHHARADAAGGSVISTTRPLRHRRYSEYIVESPYLMWICITVRVFSKYSMDAAT